MAWGLSPCAGSSKGRAAATGSDANPIAPKPPQFPARAKNVIFMFMSGGAQPVRSVLPEAELQKWDGRSAAGVAYQGPEARLHQTDGRVWASPRVFQKHGQSGMEFSDFLPHMAGCADDMEHDSLNGDGSVQSFSGSAHAGLRALGRRPGMGSWVLYGLGSECDNLPGYVVLTPETRRRPAASSGHPGFSRRFTRACPSATPATLCSTSELARDLA